MQGFIVSGFLMCSRGVLSFLNSAEPPRAVPLPLSYLEEKAPSKPNIRHLFDVEARSDRCGCLGDPRISRRFSSTTARPSKVRAPLQL